MFLVGKRGAASAMCGSIVASTPSFAKQMLLAPARQPRLGGWVATNTEAERYSTLVRVDTHLACFETSGIESSC
jgi:hypothetical protein